MDLTLLLNYLQQRLQTLQQEKQQAQARNLREMAHHATEREWELRLLWQFITGETRFPEEKEPCPVLYFRLHQDQTRVADNALMLARMGYVTPLSDLEAIHRVLHTLSPEEDVEFLCYQGEEGAEVKTAAYTPAQIHAWLHEGKEFRF